MSFETRYKRLIFVVYAIVLFCLSDLNFHEKVKTKSPERYEY